MKIINSAIGILVLGLHTMAFAADKKVEYKVDKQKSKLEWNAKKVTGAHNGNINLSDGKLISDGKNVTGGTFSIDMTSITDKDLTDAGYNEKLVTHLKSDDFFSSAKFPASTFVITKITHATGGKATVKGNLTIKGITKELEFPATIKTSGNTITAQGKMKVDRTKYDIKYGSGSFFDNLGDKAIDNEFELDVEIIATK